MSIPYLSYIRLLAAGSIVVAILAGTVCRAETLEKAVLQLKWLHHFQFAGYYAALEKGFYREAGLEVTIREGGPTAEVEKDVAAGRADFGTGTSALLLNLSHGDDLVVLGQIFQHSPTIFLTPRRTGIHSVKEMAGKRFMYSNQHGDMLALLKRNGISEDQIVKVHHNGDPRDLIEGKADVMLAYSFNEPYFMELAGEPYFTFSPQSFGIDFYGDNFFTTGKLVNERPQFVAAFRKATLRGWRYAMENKAETVDLIRSRYAPGLSREMLLFEADNLETIIQPTLVELGYQSLSRWGRISETFAELGMLPKDFDPEPIMYTPKQSSDLGPLIVTVLLSVSIISFLIYMLLCFRRLNSQLKDQNKELKCAEEELVEVNELFSLFMKHSPVYTYIKRIEGENSRVIQLSDNFIDMVGRPADELRGRIMSEIFPEEFSRKITSDDLDVVKCGRPLRLEEELNGRSYTTIKFPIVRKGKESLLAGFTIDITDSKRAEEERLRLETQFLQAQKLESLGVLAGGIAHDFNNILTAIIGNVELARMRIDKESPAADNLRRIEQSAVRAADLAGQMLAYSGRGKFIIEAIDLNRLIEEMLKLLEVSIVNKCILRLNLDRSIPSMEADATQIRQIVMNLVINSSEAIGNENGVITVRTGSFELDRSGLKDFWLGENLDVGSYVWLEIEDDGCGMDSETCSRIFDPFFSTKFTGRGLGMAAVLGIVRSHNGAVKVQSEQGSGTTFRLIFPATTAAAAAVTEPSLDEWQGRGTALLVDDEEVVREVGSEMLRELGFSVLTVSGGKEAVDIFRSRDDINFVLLDLTMPGMDGAACYGELKRIRPDVRVIVASGYSEEEVLQRFPDGSVAGFVQKPYRLSSLKEAVKRAV